MLKFAIDYAEELKRTDRATWRNPKYKWYNTGGYDEEITIENNNWNKIQMVSVNHEVKEIGKKLIAESCIIIALAVTAHVLIPPSPALTRVLVVHQLPEDADIEVVDELVYRVCKEASGR